MIMTVFFLKCALFQINLHLQQMTYKYYISDIVLSYLIAPNVLMSV